jgi:hypothetical protein
MMPANNLQFVIAKGHPGKGENIFVRHQIEGTQKGSGLVICGGRQVVGYPTAGLARALSLRLIVCTKIIVTQVIDRLNFSSQ